MKNDAHSGSRFTSANFCIWSSIDDANDKLRNGGVDDIFSASLGPVSPCGIGMPKASAQAIGESKLNAILQANSLMLNFKARSSAGNAQCDWCKFLL